MKVFLTSSAENLILGRFKHPRRMRGSFKPKLLTIAAWVSKVAVAVRAEIGTPGKKSRLNSPILEYAGLKSWPQSTTQCASSTANPIRRPHAWALCQSKTRNSINDMDGSWLEVRKRWIIVKIMHGRGGWGLMTHCKGQAISECTKGVASWNGRSIELSFPGTLASQRLKIYPLAVPNPAP